MNDRPTNPDPRKPLDEGQLLDWIDGRLTADETARLQSTSGRDGLATRVAQMQANARALRSLPMEKAPAGLRERVLAALERDALVAMERQSQSADAPPISFADHVDIHRGTPWARRGPGFALAAGIVLLMAGGVYWSTLLFDHTKPTPGHTRENTSTVIATAPTAEVGPLALAEPADQGMARSELIPETSSVARAFVGPPLPPMSRERAVELAGEGRLAVRVFTNNARGLRQVEAAGSGRAGREWRLSKTLPPAVTLALATPPTDGLVMASATDPAAAMIAPLLGPNAAFAMPRPDDPLRRVRGAYVLEVPAAESALEQVEQVFAQSLQGRVELEELPEPIALTPATPERVVWWTQPPTEWVPRVAIPVIVERAE
ncbi:MAG: hypothetical protein HBSAPP03_08390 [Phycisphaerae bacterium]|nr:MAG: hypothetical protein HBSAPP03_08390 [Phycisphaerae bacterium]